MPQVVNCTGTEGALLRCAIDGSGDVNCVVGTTYIAGVESIDTGVLFLFDDL